MPFLPDHVEWQQYIHINNWQQHHASGAIPASGFREPRDANLAVAAVLGVAIPVGCVVGLMYALSYYLVRRFYFFQAWLLIATAGVIAVTLIAALSGVDVAQCLLILVLAAAVTVVGSEALVAEMPST